MNTEIKPNRRPGWIMATALAAAFGLALVGCGRKGEKAESHEGHDHGAEAATGHEAHLHLDEIRGLGFLTVPEARAEGLWCPAEAIGDEGAQAVLSSPVQGIVSRILAAPGRALPSGTALLVIQSPELARLKADWLSAKAKRDRAQSELAREQRLFEAQAGSRRELEQARAEAAMAQAEEEASRLALEARGVSPESAGAAFTVKAPKAGSVTAFKVQMGQGVEAGQDLGEFQAASAALARMELPLPSPAGWAQGTRTEARRSDGQTWKAVLEGTPMTLTHDTKRLSYRLRLSGGPLPIPGTPLEVRVPMAKAVVLPQSALQQLEGVWGVYVKEGNEGVFRPVKRGRDLGAEVLVLEGVTPGEIVVAEGAYLLKAKATKHEVGDGHGH